MSVAMVVHSWLYHGYWNVAISVIFHVPVRMVVGIHMSVPWYHVDVGTSE
jgi:hypothetical protein